MRGHNISLVAALTCRQRSHVTSHSDGGDREIRFLCVAFVSLLLEGRDGREVQRIDKAT